MVSRLRNGKVTKMCFKARVAKENIIVHGKIQGYKVVRSNRQSIFYPNIHGEYKAGEKYTASSDLESWKSTWHGRKGPIIDVGFHGWKNAKDAHAWMVDMAVGHSHSLIVVPATFYDVVMGEPDEFTGAIEIVSREMEIGEGIVT
jgi:hypothetical protein